MVKEILCFRGQIALIDDEDFDFVAFRKWRVATNGYVVSYRPDSNDGLLLLHREIMAAPKGLQVDHINSDMLDNRRRNLRLCTPSQN